MERILTKSLQIELVTKYDTKDAYKESLGAPYPLADLDGVQIRRGSKSAVTPGQRIESFEILPAILGNPRLQGNFDRDMDKKYNSY